MRHSIILLCLLMLPAVGFSATIIVPTDYPTFQSAVDSSKIGDTVLVLPGTYVENLDLMGFIVAVRSDQGPEVTVIDGNQTGSAVVCLNGEGPTTVLEGFTLTNGLGTFDATG